MEPVLAVKALRLDAAVALPRYETAGAAGFDLAASVDMTIAPGQVTLVPTGLVLEVPHGHFLGVFARSSTPLKRGLMVANGVGIVDSDYCGPADEIKIEVFNFTAAPVEVRRGDRLAQGVILPFVRADFREVADVTRATRGGFGATGASTPPAESR
jgi:dUTP pyrophosphatase